MARPTIQLPLQDRPYISLESSRTTDSKGTESGGTESGFNSRGDSDGFIEQSERLGSYRFNEGAIGAKIPEHGVFVTTNTDEVIALPLLGDRTITLLRDGHFGEEDPLFFPQPFNFRVGHLCLIPLPSNDTSHPHAIGWYRPRDEEFRLISPKDAVGISTGLGIFNSGIQKAMLTALDKVFDRIIHLQVTDPSRLKSLNEDTYLKRYRNECKWLEAQLGCAALRQRAFLTLRLWQRSYLELVARVEWVAHYEHLCDTLSAKARAKSGTRVLGVVGALAGNAYDAFMLYQLGIPYWYVRRIEELDPTLRVDKWLEAVPSSVDVLAIRTGGFKLSMDSAEPPNPVLFQGPISADDLVRYIKMGQFLRKSASTHLYETTAMGPEPSSSMISVREPASGPIRQHKSSSSEKRYTPSEKSPKTSKKPSLPSKTPPVPTTTARNKFKDVVSPIMPKGIKSWSDALSAVGESYNGHSQPMGYALPDPQMIASSGLESQRLDSRNFFISTWLKLRHVLLFRLSCPGMEPLNARRWRTILGVEFMTYQNKKSAGAKNEMDELLKDTLGIMKSDLDISKLKEVQPEWRGVPVDVSTAPENVLREILWELFEVGFRYELLVLDHKFYCGTLPADERPADLLCQIRHFKGELVPSSSDSASNGFSSTVLVERRSALTELLNVMDDWGDKGELPSKLRRGSDMRSRFDIGNGVEISQMEMDYVEYAIAHHYISVFVSAFERAPTLPHVLY